MKLSRHNHTTMTVLKQITIRLQALHYLVALIKLRVVLLGYSDDLLLRAGDHPATLECVKSSQVFLSILIPALATLAYFQIMFVAWFLSEIILCFLSWRATANLQLPSLIQNQYIPKWIHISGAEVCVTTNRGRRCSRWGCFIHCWFTVMGKGNIHSL